MTRLETANLLTLKSVVLHSQRTGVAHNIQVTKEALTEYVKVYGSDGFLALHTQIVNLASLLDNIHNKATLLSYNNRPNLPMQERLNLIGNNDDKSSKTSTMEDIV